MKHPLAHVYVLNRFEKEKTIRILWYLGKVMLLMAYAAIFTSADSDILALTYHFNILLVLLGYVSYQLISQASLALATNPNGWKTNAASHEKLNKNVGLGLIVFQIAAGIGIAFGVVAGLEADDVAYAGTNFLIIYLQDIIFNPIINTLFSFVAAKPVMSYALRRLVGDEAITIKVPYFVKKLKFVDRILSQEFRKEKEDQRRKRTSKRSEKRQEEEEER